MFSFAIKSNPAGDNKNLPILSISLVVLPNGNILED